MVDYRWEPDAPPASGLLSSSDEFAGSGALDGKWSEWDPGGEMNTPQRGDEHAYFTVANYSSGNGHASGIYQPVPGVANWAFAAKLWLQSTHGTARIGLFVSENLDNNPSTANLHTGGAFFSISAPTIAMGTLADYAAAFSTSASLSRVDRSVYIRGRITSTTNIAWDWCDDGVGWNQITSGAIGFTPAHFGVWCRNLTGADAFVRVDWFRVVEATVALNELVPGGIAVAW